MLLTWTLFFLTASVCSSRGYSSVMWCWQMRLISRMGHCHVKQWDNIAHRGSDPTMDWLSWCAGRFWEWWMRETTVFQPNLKKSTHWCMKSRLNMRAAFKRASLLKPTMPVMAHLLSRTALLMLRPGQLPLWVVTCTATSCPTLLLWVFVTGKTSSACHMPGAD
jgi:hypothetical protein